MYRRRNRISCLSPASSPSQAAADAGRSRGKRARLGEMETEAAAAAAAGWVGRARGKRGEARRPQCTERRDGKGVVRNLSTGVDGHNRVGPSVSSRRHVMELVSWRRFFLRLKKSRNEPYETYL
jgi:hypothetical protein